MALLSLPALGVQPVLGWNGDRDNTLVALMASIHNRCGSPADDVIRRCGVAGKLYPSYVNALKCSARAVLGLIPT
ncbi:hypothetical protein [Collinsella aerofaciens]|uniref:hypothetical protein n=1 Tax=Collinsella aerofaciens TaxID=74426 RepID=UPI00359C32C2